MRDRYGREITYLRISVTDRCNLRCRYCMPEEGISRKLGHTDILSLEEIEDIVREAADLGIRKIRVTGGEPLVRRGVIDLCRKIRAIDGIEELGITTNGLLLRQDAAALKEAGVDRVNISLDTLNPEKFHYITRCGELSDVLAGIEAAEAAGLTPIKINTVLIGGFNDDEIPALCELTREKPIELRFIELMPLGPGADFSGEAFLPCSTVLERMPELIPADPSGVAKRYRLPGAKGYVGLITPITCDFCRDCNRIRLTSDGKLKPCLHSDREIPLRGLSPEERRAVLREAILGKPEQHPNYTPGIATAGGRSMNRIGG